MNKTRLETLLEDAIYITTLNIQTYTWSKVLPRYADDDLIKLCERYYKKYNWRLDESIDSTTIDFQIASDEMFNEMLDDVEIEKYVTKLLGLQIIQNELVGVNV